MQLLCAKSRSESRSWGGGSCRGGQARLALARFAPQASQREPPPDSFRRGAKFLIALAFLATFFGDTAWAQLGPVLSGAGAINRSMAGASTAAPLSSTGAMLWNPATITGLRRSQLEGSAELLFPDTELTSSIPAGALGPAGPPIDLAGSSSTDRGAFSLPAIGLAYLPEGSRFSYGLGIFAVAGFGLDYAGSVANPILSPPPPNGLGFGPISSEYQVCQIAPAMAYRLTDRLSVAAGPTIDIANLRLDPGVFGGPDDANGDGFATYPSATHAQTAWGGGFVVGTYYRGDAISLGASVKSPQWFDNFQFNTTDELGRPREVQFNLDLPMIVSIGAAYTARPGWLFAVDVRYLDFANTDGFGDQGFNPDGSLRGVGWDSIFAVALGVQHQVNNCLSVRGGYGWNGNPVPDSQASVNVASPTIIEHTLYAGASLALTPDFVLSLAYAHCFENSIEGAIVTPGGAIPGSSLSSSASADTVVLGLTVWFGGCGRCCASECQP